MSIKFNRYASGQELEEAITLVETNAGTQDEHLHNTIVSALYEAHDNHEMEPISKLIRVLPKTAHRTQLLVYIKAHAPLTWSKKGERFKLKKIKNQNPWKLEDAETTPFWEFAPESKQAEPFNAQRLVAKVRKQIEKAIDAGEFNTTEQQALRIGLAGVIHDYTAAIPKTEKEAA